jgi:hypothetical protein
VGEGVVVGGCFVLRWDEARQGEYGSVDGDVYRKHREVESA